MSEPIHIDSRGSLERLADQVREEHRSKFRRRRYAGLHTNSNRRSKFAGCEFVKVGGGMARKLSEREIEEFRRAIQRAMHGTDEAPIRLEVEQ